MSPLEVHDSGLHDLVAPDAPIERIAGGLTFTEGPDGTQMEIIEKAKA